MTLSRVLPVVLSILVIIAIAVIQERSKALAAILATMPLTAPLALWVVYSANKDNPAAVSGFTAAMVPGIFATLIFVAACWVALRFKLSFGWVMLAGWGAWGLITLINRYFFSLAR
jgi:hypothetical protein